MPGAGRNPWPASNKKSWRQSPQVQPIIRHSLRDGFNAYIALSLGTGLSCSHRLAHHHARSLASASGGQDHAILRPPRHRSSACTRHARRQSVHRIPRPRSVTIGHNAPLPSRRDARTILPIYRNRQDKYFFAADWTRRRETEVICPTSKVVADNGE